MKRALQQMGFDVQDLSQPRATMLPHGLPDLYARHPNWQLRLFIEVKGPRGRLSAHQEAWKQLERECGGRSIVVWSMEDLMEKLKELGLSIS